MTIKKMIKTTILMVVAIIISIGVVESASAMIETKEWKKPTFVYGGGLNADEINQTAGIFEILRQDVVEAPITGEDYGKYLGTAPVDTSALISSVLVVKQNNISGVEVINKTPNNITQVTQLQYTNAAITAGITNARIYVGSIKQVTGTSALTGVYKAYAMNGENLESARMEVAQVELETTNQIASSLDETDSVKLEQAIVDIKKDLADLKQQVGELATREDIERIINDALMQHQLQNVITTEQIDRLISLFERYQQTSAIDSTEVTEQLNNFANDISGRFDSFVQDAKDSGLWDRIVQFFQSIWESIMGLFGESNGVTESSIQEPTLTDPTEDLDQETFDSAAPQSDDQTDMGADQPTADDQPIDSQDETIE